MPNLSVLIASDSFKGSASSSRVGELVAEGVRRAAPDACVRSLAIADGGEGTVEAVVSARGGEIRTAEVRGPLGDPVVARYGVFDGGCAVIEVAEACGITLMERTRENALKASSFGVGELVLDAIAAGARYIYVGLGGSATSDGGAGMAMALGARLLDAEGRSIPCGLIGLKDLATIDCSCVAPELAGVELVCLTDVTNPLTGPEGAVHVYGPQKGVATEDEDAGEAWMRAYARLLEEEFGADFDAFPGAGAAGGLGAAFLAFCGARLERGIELVLDAIRLDEALNGVDLVITGEGRMDAQSAFGKAPVGVARRAKSRGIPVVAVVGGRAEDLGGVYEAGIDLVIPLPLGPSTLEECMSGASTLLPIAGESAMRAYLLGSKTR